MTIEIVDFPMKNGGSFHSYVNVYQRVDLTSKYMGFAIGFVVIRHKNHDRNARFHGRFHQVSPDVSGSLRGPRMLRLPGLVELLENSEARKPVVNPASWWFSRMWKFPQK